MPTRVSISPFGAARLLQAEAHIVLHRQVRIERVGLEHHGDAALGGRRQRLVLAIDEDGAGCDILKTGDAAQQGRFSAAGRADEDDELAVLHLEVDALQHFMRAKGLADGFELK